MTTTDKQNAKLLKPVLQVGKSGLTTGALEEIKTQLKRKRLIKLKFLKSSAESKDIKKASQVLVEKLPAELIDVVGHVIVLKYAKRKGL